MEATHSIADKYGQHLVPGESWLAERLSPALSSLERGLDDYVQYIRQAARTGRELKDDYRARKQAEIKQKGRKAFQELKNQALEELKASQFRAKEALRAKTQPKEYDSSIEKLTQQLRAQEIRRELKELEPTQRAKMLNDSAVNGNREFIDAVKEAITPLVNAETIKAAEERFERSVASQELDQVEFENYVIQKAESIAKLAERQLDLIEQHEGGDDLVGSPDHRPDLSGWNSQDKSDFIKQHGQKAYMEMSQGVRPLSDFQAAE